ncbi:MAG: chromosomal replication initiator protein DnaA [Clostridiales bacterium]|jgi:chromosomal replication initiator protein|nr:chromosomal replication initiator protein DnaA [Clostridiales bacterium]
MSTAVESAVSSELTAESIWRAVDKVLRTEFSSTSYSSWFAGLAPGYIDCNDFIIYAPNSVSVGVLQDLFLNKFKELIMRTSGVSYNVLIMANENCAQTPQNVKPAAERPKEKASPLTPSTDEELKNLGAEKLYAASGTDFSAENNNSSMTFDNFIVGSANEFAHSAARAVCDSPAYKYNPLFIYGGSGLGKTHLLHAIGHELQAQHPEWKILYTTSEKFTNDFIDSIRSGSNRIFRDVFRGLNVLLLDDVQFFAKKEKVQEEFFNTFNELKTNLRQIVITADRRLREMPLLVERLRTRIGGGLMVDVQPPDYETRVAILRKKLAETPHGDGIPSEIVDWVAERIQDNIRELEGAVLKLTAHAELSDRRMDLQLANEILGEYMQSLHTKCADTLDIIREVEDYFNLNKNSLSSGSRARTIVAPRQIAMYLCRELTEQSLPEIGRVFGGRDHSTVLHAVNKVKREMEENLHILATVNRLKEKLS